MPEYRYFVGIDIAAYTAVAVWGASLDTLQPPLTLKQTEEEVYQLSLRLKALECDPSEVLVVMEITGNYWQLLAFGLHHAGFSVAVLNPAQAHFFAQAKLKKVKSDPVDARLLAELAMTMRPEPWTPPPAIYERLHQLLAIPRASSQPQLVASLTDFARSCGCCPVRFGLPGLLAALLAASSVQLALYFPHVQTPKSSSYLSIPSALAYLGAYEAPREAPLRREPFLLGDSSAIS